MWGVAEAVREPCGLGGGGKSVEEEVGVFGGFVDGVERDVGGAGRGEHGLCCWGGVFGAVCVGVNNLIVRVAGEG